MSAAAGSRPAPSRARIALDVAARRSGASLRRASLGALRAARARGAGPFPPVAVLLHGGSWRAGYGKALMRPLCRDLVRRGWAAWNVEYRRIGGGQGGGWPATFEDVAAAIDQLARRRPRLDLERRRAARAQRGRAPGAVGGGPARGGAPRAAPARGRRAGAGGRPRARRRLVAPGGSSTRCSAARRRSSRSATRRRTRSRQVPLADAGAARPRRRGPHGRRRAQPRLRGGGARGRRRASSSSSRRAGTATTSTRARRHGRRSPRGSTALAPAGARLSCASRGPLRRQARIEHRRARRRLAARRTCSATSAPRSPSATPPGDDIVIVTSGAIARGIRVMELASRPAAMADLQAASAVGQGKLYRVYDELLRERGDRQRAGAADVLRRRPPRPLPERAPHAAAGCSTGASCRSSTRTTRRRRRRSRSATTTSSPRRSRSSSAPTGSCC